MKENWIINIFNKRILIFLIYEKRKSYLINNQLKVAFKNLFQKKDHLYYLIYQKKYKIH